MTLREAVKVRTRNEKSDSIQPPFLSEVIPGNLKLITAGEWKIIPKGTDPDELLGLVKYKGASWYSAYRMLELLKDQLKESDFHVYFTLDEEGKPTVPRIIFRVKEREIQNLQGAGEIDYIEESMWGILQARIKKSYEEREGFNFKNFLAIEEIRSMDAKTKANPNCDLTAKELRILYGFDLPDTGFVYSINSTLTEILSRRDEKADLAVLTGHEPTEISLTKKEALSGNFRYHFGDLNLSEIKTVEGDLILPPFMRGRLSLPNLEKVSSCVVMPKTVWGNVQMISLLNARGVTFPERILSRNPSGNSALLNLSSLEEIGGATLPEFVEGGVILRNILKLNGEMLPITTNTLDLNGLTTIIGLNIPGETVGFVRLGSLMPDEISTLISQNPNYRIIGNYPVS